jgi:hypothetical protein
MHTYGHGAHFVTAQAASVGGSAAHPVKVPKGGFVRERLPFIVATGGEFIGLYFWLAYWDAGSYVLATIVLWAGFLTERISVLGWVKYFHTKMEAKYPNQPPDKSAGDFKNKPKAQQLVHLFLICLSEISIWVVFVFAFDYVGALAAFVVLIVGEQLEHSMELGLIAHRPIKDYIPTWNALKITLLEAGGGIAWIWLVRNQQAQVGGLLLLLGLTIEHVVQGNKIKVDLEAPFKERQEAISQGERGSPPPGAPGVGAAPPSSMGGFTGAPPSSSGGATGAPPSGTNRTEEQ